MQKIQNLRQWAVEHPVTGEPVQPGEVITVPDEVAGCLPDGQGDLGCGLLAQTKAWGQGDEPLTEPPKRKRAPAAGGSDSEEVAQ